MSTAAAIEKRKELFRLPFSEDELEYWGPLNHEFCNSFLTMGNAFFEKYFEGLPTKTVKGIFSAFVELVQNVSEYSEKNYADNIPQSYLNLKISGEDVIIKTSNRLKTEDIDNLKNRFTTLENYSEDELKEAYKKALMGGDSLGLIMIRKMPNAHLDWEIASKNDQNWLSVELKINYGKA